MKLLLIHMFVNIFALELRNRNIPVQKSVAIDLGRKGIEKNGKFWQLYATAWQTVAKKRTNFD